MQEQRIYEAQLVRQLIIYIQRKLGEERHQFLAYDSKNESKVHKFVCRTVKETNTNTYTNTNTNTNAVYRARGNRAPSRHCRFGIQPGPRG